MSCSSLATEVTWFKNLWQLSRHLDVNIKLDKQFLMQPVHRGDRSLIMEFFCIGFIGSNLQALKVVANFKCVFHLSDIV